ncbi:hypothetical protein [Bdellovibrio sp. KM01]|uniref:hypothetical protein n=1 Tax=Bdellovibrio sp. KM01 TaxID=2748865 RepID=UPI0015EAE32F|nr:hypothetical protein [Bdellovibrio sp. KM01]QLY25264.1 hypothetical protein HW988_17900 [Bdellovibrio sp. KM01]
MLDASPYFRVQSLEMLRAAMAARESEVVGAIRAIMTAVDNASAVPKEEIAKLNPSVTEVPRRPVPKEKIADIIRAEMDVRRQAKAEYERLGHTEEAEKFRLSLITLDELLKFVI